MSEPLIILPEIELVDALGYPLRSEPGSTGTYANSEHAQLTMEALEAAARALMPRPDPFEWSWSFRHSFASLMPRTFPFVIRDLLDTDEPPSPTD